MNDSKKLPSIEVGDTVIFRTDLVVYEYYGAESFEPDMVRFVNRNQVVSKVFNPYFLIEGGDDYYFTPEMVAEVIKPSKALVYSEQDLKKAYEKGLEYGYHFDGSRSDWEAEGLSSHLSDEYVKSLNEVAY